MSILEAKVGPSLKCEFNGRYVLILPINLSIYAGSVMVIGAEMKSANRGQITVSSGAFNLALIALGKA